MTGPEIAHEPLPEAAPAPAPAASEHGAEPRRQGTPFLVLQFFLFPMAIVAVCVGVFIVFGLIANEGKGAREYLDEIKSGSANRRWPRAPGRHHRPEQGDPDERGHDEVRRGYPGGFAAHGGDGIQRRLQDDEEERDRCQRACTPFRTRNWLPTRRVGRSPRDEYRSCGPRSHGWDRGESRSC